MIIFEHATENDAEIAIISPNTGFVAKIHESKKNSTSYILSLNLYYISYLLKQAIEFQQLTKQLQDNERFYIEL